MFFNVVCTINGVRYNCLNDFDDIFKSIHYLLQLRVFEEEKTGLNGGGKSASRLKMHQYQKGIHSSKFRHHIFHRIKS